jgi:dolichyl-phosphate beta-glucosyltransferase
VSYGPRSPLGLVVPVFNEAIRVDDYGKLLLDFAADLPGGSELLFVDDGSTDDTVERISALLSERPEVPARLMRRRHAGKGAAVAAGLHALRAPLVGFCDVDLSTPLEDLDRITGAAARAGALAIGSRGLATSTLVRAEGPVRESLGRAYNRLLQAVVTPGVVDTQCGAKVAPRAVWDALLPHCREVGYAWDGEVVAVAQALGIAVVEVPVNWRHDERSKVKVGRDGIAMVVATPRIRRSARRAVASRPPRADPVPPSRIAVAPRKRSASSEVFDDTNAATLAEADRSHWWFRSKAALVATALRRTVRPRDERGWLVDIGGGAGGVTALLGWPPDRVAVLEGNHALARQAHRSHGLAALRALVDHAPVGDGAAEVVCLLDVLEHLHDPSAALRETHRVLAPDGRLVVTVPAHRWLWSAADEQLGHVKRYTRLALATELVASGFEPMLVTHVFSWLVPPVFVTRKLRSSGSSELGLDRTSVALDKAAMALTYAERHLLGRVRLPFGTSILCVAVRHPLHRVRDA